MCTCIYTGQSVRLDTLHFFRYTMLYRVLDCYQSSKTVTRMLPRFIRLQELAEQPITSQKRPCFFCLVSSLFLLYPLPSFLLSSRHTSCLRSVFLHSFFMSLILLNGPVSSEKLYISNKKEMLWFVRINTEESCVHALSDVHSSQTSLHRCNLPFIPTSTALSFINQLPHCICLYVQQIHVP